MRAAWTRQDQAKTCNHHWVEVGPVADHPDEPMVRCTRCDTITQGTPLEATVTQAVAQARVRWAVKQFRAELAPVTDKQLVHAWADALENATDRAEYNQAEFIEAEMTVRGLDTAMT